MSSTARLILYNVGILFLWLNLLYWTIPLVGAMSRAWKTTFLETVVRPIPQSYDAKDHAWVKQHWIELNRGGGAYRSYVGWRHAPMAGETITVEGAYRQRRTLQGSAAPAKTVYFFGGSAMWGYGVNDGGTIPSQFAALTRLRAENFAEQAWIAHQSLILLIELIQAGHRPDVVVFYDGVNDALERCRRELPVLPLAHQRERDFERVLRASLQPESFSHYLAPVFAVMANVGDKLANLTGSRWYDCDTDPAKAEAVASAFVKDWQLARQLVEQQGGKFLGLLQPVTTFSRTRLDHLQLSDQAAQQYRAVYPRIRQKLADERGFHDLTAILDRDEYIYIDWCHVAPHGNRYVAEKVAALVADQ